MLQQVCCQVFTSALHCKQSNSIRFPQIPMPFSRCWRKSLLLHAFVPLSVFLRCCLSFDLNLCAADDINLDCFMHLCPSVLWGVVSALTGWYWACHQTTGHCFPPTLCQWSCSGEQWSRRCRPPSERPAMHTAPHKCKIWVTQYMCCYTCMSFKPLNMPYCGNLKREWLFSVCRLVFRQTVLLLFFAKIGPAIIAAYMAWLRHQASDCVDQLMAQWKLAWAYHSLQSFTSIPSSVKDRCH